MIKLIIVVAFIYILSLMWVLLVKPSMFDKAFFMRAAQYVGAGILTAISIFLLVQLF